MKTKLFVFIGLLTLSFPVFATEHEVSIFGGILDECYAAAETEAGLGACIGKMSTHCMDSEEGGYSTLGMASCTNAEAQVWDKYLNEEYRIARDGFRAMDADEAIVFPEFAKRTETLLAAQRAWIAFRDAECGLEYALWGSGSMRNIAWASCNLEMTARRAIQLKFMGSEMR